MATYARATQLKVARDIQDRALATLMRGRILDVGDESYTYWQRVRNCRATNSLNSYLEFFCEMKTKAGETRSTDSVSWFDDLYAACRPHFEDTELRRRG